jgi:hypothetical protein
MTILLQSARVIVALQHPGKDKPCPHFLLHLRFI